MEKKKTISKSYSVTPEQQLKIENSFGDVVINTWDKNEITVDIEIMVRSSSEEKAIKLLGEIDVKDNNDGRLISFKTNVGEMNDGSHKNRNGNKSFHIDYKVNMPSANRLQLENSFGKIIMPDFKGEVSLTSKFGGLTAGKLQQVQAIDVEFGTATIGEVNNGKVTFKFNSESTIGKIGGSVKINSEFSQHVQLGVSDNIGELTVNESYSTLRMVIGKDLSAGFDVHTSFGQFRNESGIEIKEKNDEDNDTGPRFDKDFSGKTGEGKARIRIKSSFGSVKLTNIFDHSVHGKGREEKEEKEEKGQSEKEGKEPA